jgi:hypothetical protein
MQRELQWFKVCLIKSHKYNLSSWF